MFQHFRALMRHGISIWIDVPLDMLANEIQTTEVPTTVAQATYDSDSFTEVVNLFFVLFLSWWIMSPSFSLFKIMISVKFNSFIRLWQCASIKLFDL